ncbi:hypothetical protein, partial [Faecalibacterium sp. BCRC 81149]|uniref:hypothetical protein n=1 Tax=Faecalibacterium sp. BCRC 81149 TaxID=2315463 RepID=UPI001FA71191
EDCPQTNADKQNSKQPTAVWLGEQVKMNVLCLIGIGNDTVGTGASSDTELFKNYRSTIRFQGHRIATCLYRTPMGSRV